MTLKNIKNTLKKAEDTLCNTIHEHTGTHKSHPDPESIDSISEILSEEMDLNAESTVNIAEEDLHKKIKDLTR